MYERKYKIRVVIRPRVQGGQRKELFWVGGGWDAHRALHYDTEELANADLDAARRLRPIDADPPTLAIDTFLVTPPRAPAVAPPAPRARPVATDGKWEDRKDLA